MQGPQKPSTGFKSAAPSRSRCARYKSVHDKDEYDEKSQYFRLNFRKTTTFRPRNSRCLSSLLSSLLVYYQFPFTRSMRLCHSRVFRITAFHAEKNTSNPKTRPHNRVGNKMLDPQLPFERPCRRSSTTGGLSYPRPNQIDVAMIFAKFVLV